MNLYRLWQWERTLERNLGETNLLFQVEGILQHVHRSLNTTLLGGERLVLTNNKFGQCQPIRW